MALFTNEMETLLEIWKICSRELVLKGYRTQKTFYSRESLNDGKQPSFVSLVLLS